MDDEVEEMMKPFSRRMGWMDVPVCLLSFITATASAVTSLAGDLTMIAAAHANYLRDEREFRGIVKNYDNTSGIGAGGSESQD